VGHGRGAGRDVRPSQQPGRHWRRVRSDGDLLAAADGNGRAYLWDLVSGELARTFVPRRRGGLNDLAFGLGGDLLAAAGGSGQAYLWDVVSGKIAGTYIIPGDTTVYAVAFGRRPVPGTGRGGGR